MREYEQFTLLAKQYTTAQERLRQLKKDLGVICYHNDFANCDSCFYRMEMIIHMSNINYVESLLGMVAGDEFDKNFLRDAYINKYAKDSDFKNNTELAKKYGVERNTVQLWLREFSEHFDEMCSRDIDDISLGESDEYMNIKELFSDISNMQNEFRKNQERLIETNVKILAIKSPNTGESIHNPTPAPKYFNEAIHLKRDLYNILCMMQDEIIKETYRVIKKLPRWHQAVVVMHYFENVSYVEIAKQYKAASVTRFTSEVNNSIKAIAHKENTQRLKLLVAQYRVTRDEKNREICSMIQNDIENA